MLYELIFFGFDPHLDGFRDLSQKKSRAATRQKTEKSREKNRDQRRAREQRLQEWGHHHTKPAVAVAVAGSGDGTAGAADAAQIVAERAAAQHPRPLGI